jgi:hypothetical protein
MGKHWNGSSERPPIPSVLERIRLSIISWAEGLTFGGALNWFAGIPPPAFKRARSGSDGDSGLALLVESVMDLFPSCNWVSSAFLRLKPLEIWARARRRAVASPWGIHSKDWGSATVACSLVALSPVSGLESPRLACSRPSDPAFWAISQMVLQFDYAPGSVTHTFFIHFFHHRLLCALETEAS